LKQGTHLKVAGGFLGGNITNPNIYNCLNGIVLDNRHEYITIQNAWINDCYIGIQTSAGNTNIFGGNVSANTFAIKIMDGANDSHSTIDGILLNHNDTAIYIDSIANALLINNCQIFSGIVHLRKSKGVVFDANNFGGAAFKFEGSKACHFSDNVYTATGFTNDFNGETSWTTFSGNIESYATDSIAGFKIIASDDVSDGFIYENKSGTEIFKITNDTVYVDENLNLESGGQISQNGIQLLRIPETEETNSIIIGNGGNNTMTGSANICVGTGAGRYITTGAQNVFLGRETGFINTITGSRNMCIGSISGRNIEGGGDNVFVGYNSGNQLTSGVFNMCLGSAAGRNIVGGNKNVAIGGSALYQNQSGEDNIAIGFEALYNNTSFYNVAIGSRAGYTAGNVGNNIYIGRESGYGTTGSQNTFIGTRSGYANTGSGNIFLGYYSGRSEAGSNKLVIDNANDNVPIIGADMGANKYVSINTDMTALAANLHVTSTAHAGATDVLLIEDDLATELLVLEDDGDFNLSDSLLWTNGTNNLTIFGSDNDNSTVVFSVKDKNGVERFHITDSGKVKFQSNYLFSPTPGSIIIGDNVTTITGDDNSLFGSQAGSSLTSGVSNTVIGSGAGNSITSGGYNTFLGYQAGYNNISTTSTNLFSGYKSGYNASGALNVFLGSEVGYNVTSNENVAIGNSALFNAKGNQNIAIGKSALYGHATNFTGLYNIGIGSGSGAAITGANHCILLGFGSGAAVTTSEGSILMGYNSGSRITTGGYSIGIGYQALQGNITSNLTGAFNIGMGYQAGQDISTGAGSTLIGSYSGKDLTTGGQNTFLGYNTGSTATTAVGNVFLGYQAGQNETGSNLLYIENSNSATPLIWGDFADDSLIVNGILEVTDHIKSDSASIAAVYGDTARFTSYVGHSDITNIGSPICDVNNLYSDTIENKGLLYYEPPHAYADTIGASFTINLTKDNEVEITNLTNDLLVKREFEKGLNYSGDSIYSPYSTDHLSVFKFSYQSKKDKLYIARLRDENDAVLETINIRTSKDHVDFTSSVTTYIPGYVADTRLYWTIENVDSNDDITIVDLKWYLKPEYITR